MNANKKIKSHLQVPLSLDSGFLSFTENCWNENKQKLSWFELTWKWFDKGVSSDHGLYDYGERHSRKSSQPNELKSPSEESGNQPHHDPHASPFTDVSAAEAAISSTENLLRNIQGLLKVAAENAKQQERRISMEKGERVSNTNMHAGELSQKPSFVVNGRNAHNVL